MGLLDRDAGVQKLGWSVTGSSLGIELDNAV
jgi:hypothetical protein